MDMKLMLVFTAAAASAITLQVHLRKRKKNPFYNLKPAALVSVDCSGVDFEAVFAERGERGRGHVPPGHLPMDAGFLHVAREYSRISFGGGAAFERALMDKPYQENPGYVQIGWLGEQNPALMKRNSQDPRVFFFSAGKRQRKHPDRCAASVDAYLAMACLMRANAPQSAKKGQV